MIRRRLVLRQTRADASDAVLAVYEKQLRSYGPIIPPRYDEAVNQFHLVVDTDAPPREAARSVVDVFIGH